jgi:4-hydroxybenzoate polyprenyltransferase
VPGLVRSYLELCRASNLPTVWTNVMAAVVLSRAHDPVGQVLGAALAPAAALTLIYLGGMALNDLLDLEEDRVKKPSRPLPSGRISLDGARLFTAALFGTGLTLLVLFCARPAVWAGLVLVATVYLYDRLHRLSAATVLLMASCRALVFVVSALAVSATVNRAVAIAAGVQFGYIVTLTVVARWEKSAPRAFQIPPIPWMLAAISLLDGVMLAILAHPAWLLGGILGAALTRIAQTQVRGD